MDPVGENPSKHWKFKNDLLKTKADIVSQSREILQTFVWWGQICIGLSSCRSLISQYGESEVWFSALKIEIFLTFTLGPAQTSSLSCIDFLKLLLVRLKYEFDG